MRPLLLLLVCTVLAGGCCWLLAALWLPLLAALAGLGWPLAAICTRVPDRLLFFLVAAARWEGWLFPGEASRCRRWSGLLIPVC
jgi:hypothetical protein